MIDAHIHVVKPRLPGVGALSALLESGPAEVAAALRRGLNHVAAQTLMLLLPFCVAVWFVIPNFPPYLREFLAVMFFMAFLPVWTLGLGRHTALAAGQRRRIAVAAAEPARSIRSISGVPAWIAAWSIARACAVSSRAKGLRASAGQFRALVGKFML